MRRMFPVAFLSALLVAFPSAFAQRGGHSAGSFGHSFGSGGFSSGSFSRSSGFATRGYSFSAPRLTSTAPLRNLGPGYRVPYGGISADRRDGRNGYHYRSPYRGFGIYGGYPYYANSWELLPWDLGYPDFTGYGYDDSGRDTEQQPAASVAPPDDGYRPGYQEPADKDYAPASVANSVAPEPELTLIFNDGHREAIHNYALTSKMVIVMDQAPSGREQRIPLASLNLPATEQAAQQAGLDFVPPA